MKKAFGTSDFLKKKQAGEKISMLTAYDFTMARLLDEAGVDTILVGDSLGMVMLGYEDTLKVTMEDMIHHTKAVARGRKQAYLVADMPFLSYHVSVEKAIENAGRLITEGGAQAVKMEGGFDIIDKIAGVIKAQIPVVGHLGLTPQSVHKFGGFKVQGKDEAAARQIIDEALALQEAGVVAIVLECIPEKLATLVSEKLQIPTIGIGAGAGCDGQVLVLQDFLGLYGEFLPKFVKRYALLGDQIKEATRAYIEEVEEGTFPAKEHTFSMDETLLEKLY